MRLLLDTHIIIWLILQPTTLTPAERAAIDAPEADLLMSAASVWEVRAKWLAARRSRRVWELSPSSLLAFAASNALTVAPLSAEACAAELVPALAHRDPFDEMLLVHASTLGARLLTRDSTLVGHPLAYQP